MDGEILHAIVCRWLVAHPTRYGKGQAVPLPSMASAPRVHISEVLISIYLGALRTSLNHRLTRLINHTRRLFNHISFNY